MKYQVKANTISGNELEVMISADNKELAEQQFIKQYGTSDYIIKNIQEFGSEEHSDVNCNSEIKICPKCAEEIKLNAVVCRFCGFSYVNNQSVSLSRKIQTSTGAARGCISFIIPGLGQFASGEIGLGIAFFVLAVVIGIFTFGIGGFVVAIIAAIMCKPIFECSNCRTKVDEKAKCCPACKETFE